MEAPVPDDQLGLLSTGPSVALSVHVPPTPRIRDPLLLALLKHEYDECELSGQTRDLHLHHVIYKSHSGDDLRQNIICLHSPLHDAYHAGDPEAKLALATLVDTARSDVAAYISEKLGGAQALLYWFERHGL